MGKWRRKVRREEGITRRVVLGWQWNGGRRSEGRGWGWVPQEVLTCHQVPNEKGLVFLVVFQHALEVLLFPLDGDLPVELMALLLTLS